MKYLIACVTLLLAVNVASQETQCVDVPKGQKLVLIPWFVPTDELVWKWKPAKPVKVDDECDELGVSPATCEKD